MYSVYRQSSVGIFNSMLCIRSEVIADVSTRLKVSVSNTFFLCSSSNYIIFIFNYKCYVTTIIEFIYPATWVGDQTLLYRAAEKTERETSLDLPPARISRRKNVNEPVVAFGPPGSTGELNVSVIVSPVSPTFS